MPIVVTQDQPSKADRAMQEVVRVALGEIGVGFELIWGTTMYHRCAPPFKMHFLTCVTLCLFLAKMPSSRHHWVGQHDVPMTLSWLKAFVRLVVFIASPLFSIKPKRSSSCLAPRKNPLKSEACRQEDELQSLCADDVVKLRILPRDVFFLVPCLFQVMKCYQM